MQEVVLPYSFVYCRKTFKPIFRAFFHHFIKNIFIREVRPIAVFCFAYQSVKKFGQIEHISKTGVYTVVTSKFLCEKTGDVRADTQSDMIQKPEKLSPRR